MTKAATTVRTTLLHLSACAGLTFAAACGSDEAQGTEDHTPVSFTVFVDDAQTALPLTLNAGTTVRIRFKFENAAGDDLDEVEGEHFAGLSFTPTTLATSVTRVSGHNYQFDVAVGLPGSGTARLGYGHDEAADQTTFDPFAVTIQGSGGGGAN